MNSDTAFHDSRVAMLRARSRLDDYAASPSPNSEEFARLFEELKVATEEYARLVKLKFKQKYSNVGVKTG